MRSLFSTAALSLISMSFVAACSSEGEYDELAGETAADDVANADGKGDVAADGAYTYYSIRGDTRRCASPYCGGEWLERLNRTTTVCHDNKASAACYTPELDFTESGLKQEAQDALRLAASQGAFAGGPRALVRGRFAKKGTAGKLGAELGRFIVTEAWVAQGDAETDGVFVRVKDSGIRCIAAPCPSTRETALNTSRSENISDINFAPSGIDEETVGSLYEKMYQPSGMIIAGERFTVKVGSRSGKGRTATNAFVRLENKAASPECFEGGCSGQICSDQAGAISTCEFRPEYACYQTATCEVQPSGKCGWTPTAALNACLGMN